jgi:hypothetical protein
MPGPADDKGPIVTDDGASRLPYLRAARYLPTAHRLLTDLPAVDGLLRNHVSAVRDSPVRMSLASCPTSLRVS